MVGYDRTDRRNGPSRLGMVAVVAGSVAALGACDGLLEVDLPGELTEEELLVPDMAETMVTSAIAEYECAFSQFVAAVGGLEDAYWESTGWWTRRWTEYQIHPTTGDINNLTCRTSPTGGPGFHGPFQSARMQAEQAYEEISEWSPEEITGDQGQLLATAATFAGLVYQKFGEHWCEITVDTGPLMTSEDALREAEGWLDRAVQHVQATGDFANANTESMEQFAHMARARVRFALGDHQGAAADAERIEPGFEAWATRSAEVRGRYNQVYDALTFLQYGTIADTVRHNGEVVSTGYRHMVLDDRGLPAHSRTEGTPDTRVQVDSAGEAGQDGVTPHWVQQKHTSRSTDMTIAKWAEAQLILAEIEGGQAAIDRINELRDFRGLPQVTDLGDWTVQELIIEERRREFFLEGRFHADKIRFDLWFPEATGFNHKGIAYGPTTCLPLGQTERDVNPNIDG